MTKADERREKILRHGFHLKRIFTEVQIDPVTLVKRIHRLEIEAHRLAERECNEQLPEGYSEKKEASILRRLDELIAFRAANVPVFLNGDPRGYALKIEDAYVKAHDIEIERDWGGYGILAPEF